ncbi:rod-binding protein [uncultured Algimonas sp.]|uniref:rod-binding protein n=1 Tax=uncultured Algimonas sp. TaxID=1547920 RepID=UPI00260E5697|nr:rod-binding protein [uncultured Algimonas sp.]
MIPNGLPLPSVPLATTPSPAQAAQASADGALRAVAEDFEAAFIAQMLTHSGLAESMTSGEGKMAEAFGSFYVEQLAERLTNAGGFGMADSIYRQLERYAEPGTPATATDPKTNGGP